MLQMFCSFPFYIKVVNKTKEYPVIFHQITFRVFFYKTKALYIQHKLSNKVME